MKNALRWTLSLALGMLVGMIIHYSLYRIGLPLQPFIYMAF
ncbi:hypothetical protein BH10PLA1_BH10PLA1_20950 [soil metagenome]